jgi:hypothetical protein
MACLGTFRPFPIALITLTFNGEARARVLHCGTCPTLSSQERLNRFRIGSGILVCRNHAAAHSVHPTSLVKPAMLDLDGASSAGAPNTSPPALISVPARILLIKSQHTEMTYIIGLYARVSTVPEKILRFRLSMGAAYWSNTADTIQGADPFAVVATHSLYPILTITCHWQDLHRHWNVVP